MNQWLESGPLATSGRRLIALCVAPSLMLTGMFIHGLNRGPTPQQIAAGEELFLHEWTVNDPMSGGGDGLGPVFNARSCVACHSQGGVGGGGGNEHNVMTFEVDPDRGRSEVVSHVVHADAVRPDLQETRQSVQDLFPIIPNGVRVVSGCSVNLANHNPVHFDEVNSPALFGVGVIDQISDLSITVHNAKRMGNQWSDEFSGEFRHNGQGFARTSRHGRYGKFGWKGQFATVREFVAAACAMELGLTNPLTAQPIPREHNEDADAELDMTAEQLDNLVAFVKSLPAPQQILPDAPEARRRVEEGEMLFAEIKCTDCHVKDLDNAHGIYTDFKLYSLERSFSSGYTVDERDITFERPGTVPLPEHWQTPPLWGVADSAPYFHDGQSATLQAAIARHFGDADHSRKLYSKLSKDDQNRIVEFLKTLRAPQNVMKI